MILSKLFFTIIIFLLSASTVSAANYYVDNGLSSSGNGTSWEQAWKSFSDISWNQLGAGDTLYISGGSSSKNYTQELSINASGSSSNPLTVRSGNDLSHNGEVIFAGSGSGSAISIDGQHDIIVDGFTINDWGKNVEVDGDSRSPVSNITFQNLKGRMHGRFFHIDGWQGGGNFESAIQNITIKNTTATTKANSGQTDFIYAQYMKGLTIENNNSNISNENTSPHNDHVQTFWVDGPVVVRNNYFIHTDHKAKNSQGIFFENYRGNYDIYNNVVIQKNSNLDGKIYFKTGSQVKQANIRIINNTVWGSSGSLIKFDTSGTAVVKNNILYSTGRLSNGSTRMLEASAGSLDSDYNLFYDPAGNMSNGTSGSNSIEANPQFSNPSSMDGKISSSSPVINSGVNLGSYFNTDKSGNSRGGSWDIGAYEYNSSEPNPSPNPSPSPTPSLSPTPSPSPLPTPSLSPRPSSSPSIKLCQGDINGDKVVNLKDFSLLSQSFFTSTPNNPADLNNDSVVNLLDFSILSRNFFKDCS